MITHQFANPSVSNQPSQLSTLNPATATIKAAATNNSLRKHEFSVPQLEVDTSLNEERCGQKKKCHTGEDNSISKKGKVFYEWKTWRPIYNFIFCNRLFLNFINFSCFTVSFLMSLFSFSLFYFLLAILPYGQSVVWWKRLLLKCLQQKYQTHWKTAYVGRQIRF